MHNAYMHVCVYVRRHDTLLVIDNKPEVQTSVTTFVAVSSLRMILSVYVTVKIIGLFDSRLVEGQQCRRQ